MKPRKRLSRDEVLGACSDAVRSLNRQFFGEQAHVALAPVVSTACGDSAKATAPRRSRQPNGTEARYGLLLEARKRMGEIADYRFEGLTFRIGDGVTYRPDFAVIYPDGRIECVEVKGGGPPRDDSVAKWKVAVERWPMFGWVWAVWKGGEWTVKRFERSPVSEGGR